jgi:hypothetical protein
MMPFLEARQQAEHARQQHARVRDTSEPRVIFDYLGIHHDMSWDESLLLVAAVRHARDALKVKCPTCRCRVLPGTECGCCAEFVVGGVQG